MVQKCQKPKIISAVVCTYNRSGLLADCLHSLACQSLDSSRYEVIIVDNNSTDNTRQVAKKFLQNHQNFRYVMELQQGLSYARNKGWQEAGGSYVAYLDDDARAIPQWLELILHSFENVTPRPIAVGGEICPIYEMSPPVWFIDDFELRTWGEKAAFLVMPLHRFGFSGSNMAFQRWVLEKYEGFREDFGMHGTKLGIGEETDLFFRIYTMLPYFWYDPAIRVYHWTPVRNMKVSYRMKRSFRAGTCHSVICGRIFFSKQNLGELIRLCALIVSSPLRVARCMGLRRTATVKILQDISYRLGLMIGSKG